MADDRDPVGGPGTYNSMQAQVGLLPPFAANVPPVTFPGQISAMMAASLGSPGTSFGAGMFPTQELQTFAGSNPLVRGPTGLMMPLGAGAPYNPYGAPSPRPAGLAGGGLFAPHPPMPPPAYAGYQGHFAPFLPPPPPMFQNPYTAQVYQREATEDRGFGAMMGGAGMGARLGTNMMAGAAGFMMGGPIGGLAGFLGSEFSGLGRAGSNAFMNNVMAPIANMRASGAGIEQLSRGFVSGGPFLHESGMGFSRQGGVQAARMLEDMSNSTAFRRDTQNRFNQQDVMKIAELGSQNELMQGVGSPTQMRDRVRDIAKSVSAFMELAQEPDIQRAISTMGQLRSSGLNLSETLQAVSHGRMFARMAGTSFQDLISVGGALGSQTFQSMGLSQGLGTQVGMSNYGMARAAQNAGSLSPQMMNLMGGAQGYANMNNMFSGTMLQMPMMAPGMMTPGGGLNANALQQMMSGQMSMFGMTGRGANMLTSMTGRMGAEGLGMAVAMQPMLQDQIGRAMESQGPFARRFMEDRQVMSMSREMGMRGPAGFLTAAQALGMDRNQAIARATELGDPRYFQRMRDQTRVTGRERDAEERRQIEADRPGLVDELASESSTIYGAREGLRGMGRGIRNLTEAIAGGGPNQMYQPTSRFDMARLHRTLRSREFGASIRGDVGGAVPMAGSGFMDRLSQESDIAEYAGGRGIASSLGAVARMFIDSDQDRAGMARQMERGRRMSAQLRNATLSEQRDAQRQLGSTFGGSTEAQGAFASELANLYGTPQGRFGGMAGHAINAGFRGGVGFLTAGAIDPGDIVGGRDVTPDQIQAAYVRTMTGRGMSSEQAAASFRSNQSGILGSTGGLARAMMSDVGRSRLDQASTRGVAGRQGVVDVEAMERQAYGGIFGTQIAGDARSRRAIDSAFSMFGEGVGGNERQQSASRRFMAGMALLQRASQGGDPARSSAARQRMAQLAEEARREGVDVTGSMDQFNRNQRALSGNQDIQAAAGQLDINAVNMRSLGAFEGDRDRNAAMRQLSAGVSVLGQQRGMVGELFQGLTEGGHLNMSGLDERLSGVSRDQIRELSRQDPRLAALVRQLQSSSGQRRENVMGQLREYVATRGEGREHAQREYVRLGIPGRLGRGWEEGSGLFGGIAGAVASAFGGEERFVRREARAGTRAADEEGRQLGEVSQMEGEAQGSSIGGASDELHQASLALQRATENLNQAISGDGVGHLIDRNNG
jgi:hypothetical protein